MSTPQLVGYVGAWILQPCQSMKTTILVLLSGLILTVAPAPALAQPEFLKDNIARIVNKVGVRLNASVREPVDDDVTKGTTFGASLGFASGQTDGWRYPIGITSFSENLHSPNGQLFAVLRSRGIMAGIGYGLNFGRLSTGASLQAGFAINRTTTEGDLLSAFQVPGGAVSVHAGNAFLLKPQLKAEYFITPKFTFRVSADYMLTQPDITVTTPAGTISDRWNASNFHASIGFGVYPFRK